MEKNNLNSLKINDSYVWCGPTHSISITCKPKPVMGETLHKLVVSACGGGLLFMADVTRSWLNVLSETCNALAEEEAVTSFGWTSEKISENKTIYTKTVTNKSITSFTVTKTVVKTSDEYPGLSAPEYSLNLTDILTFENINMKFLSEDIFGSLRSFIDFHLERTDGLIEEEDEEYPEFEGGVFDGEEADEDDFDDLFEVDESLFDDDDFDESEDEDDYFDDDFDEFEDDGDCFDDDCDEFEDEEGYFDDDFDEFEDDDCFSFDDGSEDECFDLNDDDEDCFDFDDDNEFDYDDNCIRLDDFDDTDESDYDEDDFFGSDSRSIFDEKGFGCDDDFTDYQDLNTNERVSWGFNAMNNNAFNPIPSISLGGLNNAADRSFNEGYEKLADEFVNFTKEIDNIRPLVKDLSLDKLIRLEEELIKNENLLNEKLLSVPLCFTHSINVGNIAKARLEDLKREVVRRKNGLKKLSFNLNFIFNGF